MVSTTDVAFQALASTECEYSVNDKIFAGLFNVRCSCSLFDVHVNEPMLISWSLSLSIFYQQTSISFTIHDFYLAYIALGYSNNNKLTNALNVVLVWFSSARLTNNRGAQFCKWFIARISKWPCSWENNWNIIYFELKANKQITKWPVYMTVYNK